MEEPGTPPVGGREGGETLPLRYREAKFMPCVALQPRKRRTPSAKNQSSLIFASSPINGGAGNAACGRREAGETPPLRNTGGVTTEHWFIAS